MTSHGSLSRHQASQGETRKVSPHATNKAVANALAEGPAAMGDFPRNIQEPQWL